MRLPMCLIALVTASAYGSPVMARPLDAFLAGFDDACAYSASLDGFFRSSYLFARGEGALDVPADLSDTIGTPSVTPQDEYLRILIPVIDGTWRGVPVREFEIYITREASGFVYHGVNFDRAATDEAAATFTSIGARAKDNLGTSEGAETNTGFSLHDGQPAYFCDSST